MGQITESRAVRVMTTRTGKTVVKNGVAVIRGPTEGHEISQIGTSVVRVPCRSDEIVIRVVRAGSQGLKGSTRGRIGLVKTLISTVEGITRLAKTKDGQRSLGAVNGLMAI